MHKPPSPKPTGPARRFAIANTCDGYEVIDQDGTPVTGTFEFANRPLQIAGQLNNAVATGSLARALGCIEDEDVFGEVAEAFDYEV